MGTNREQLIEALSKSLEAWLKEQLPVSGLLGRLAPEESILAPLIEGITESDDYKAVEGHSILSVYSVVVIDAFDLARRTLYKVEDRELDPAIDWLLRVLRTREASASFIAPIWGMTIDEAVVLGRGWRLVPFDQLPESPAKSKLVGDASTNSFVRVVWRSQWHYDIPRVALIKHMEAFPYLRPEVDEAGDLIQDAEASATNLMWFLQGKVASKPLAMSYWFEYDDTDLDLGAHESRTAWHDLEIAPRIYANIDTSSAQVTRDFEKLGAMEDPRINVLWRAMRRYTLSQMRREFGDRALELGIAFETLTRAGDSTDSITWKVAVRTALMIGGSPEERLANRNIMTKFYGVRSKTAHGRSDIEPKEKELVERATELFRQLLEKLWNHTKSPCWKSIELNGGDIPCN